MDSSVNDVLDDVESDLVAGRWRLRAPASLATPRRVRAELRRWLVALRWPEEEAADIVLAVDEAVSNAVEHAFPPGAPDGTVEVVAEVEPVDRQRRLRVRIRDTGRWLPRPGPEEDVNRRRGLPMMSVLMAEVLIHRGGPAPSDGTVVTLLSPPVPTL